MQWLNGVGILKKKIVRSAVSLLTVVVIPADFQVMNVHLFMGNAITIFTYTALLNGSPKTTKIAQCAEGNSNSNKPIVKIRLLCDS
jgi:hypothetical protein